MAEQHHPDVYDIDEGDCVQLHTTEMAEPLTAKCVVVTRNSIDDPDIIEEHFTYYFDVLDDVVETDKRLYVTRIEGLRSNLNAEPYPKHVPLGYNPSPPEFISFGYVENVTELEQKEYDRLRSEYE